jgi:hypothetical protein
MMMKALHQTHHRACERWNVVLPLNFGELRSGMFVTRVVMKLLMLVPQIRARAITPVAPAQFRSTLNF